MGNREPPSKWNWNAVLWIRDTIWKVQYKICVEFGSLIYYGSLSILEIISNMIQSDYLQHWFPSTIFYTLRIQSEIQAQHGEHGSTQWRDCVECCCCWFGRENIHMLTCKTRLLSELILHILNTSPEWIEEFLDIQKRHRSGLHIAFSIFLESLKNCTHHTVYIR